MEIEVEMVGPGGEISIEMEMEMEGAGGEISIEEGAGVEIWIEEEIMRRENERVTIHIHDMVSNLTPYSQERCIFRVPDALRHTNEEFYEPTIVSIGPYHRGNPRLASMEKHKVHCVKQMLKKYGETSLERCVQAVRRDEKRVREFYAEPIEIVSSNEFIQMLVLDGCFILELFRMYWNIFPNPMIKSDLLFISENFKLDDDDTLVLSPHLIIPLPRDLLLMENQIPFFILEALFNTIHRIDPTNNHLTTLTLFFIYSKIQKYYNGKIEQVFAQLPRVLEQDICHLLHLAHEVVYCGISSTTNSPSLETYINPFFYSATKLEEANVKLTNKSSDLETTSIFDITFAKGELKIPTVTFHDGSEMEIRNFIAFEMCQQHPTKWFFCFYATFLDHLVASDDDVNLLIDRGILINWMIDAKSVNNMLSKITKNIPITNCYTYLHISKELTEYCKRPHNKWKAILMQKYFNTPWAFISFLAGFLLLAMTATQTVFSIKK